MKLEEYLVAIEKELERATKLYGPFTSPHHGYGVAAEEFDEFWQAIKENQNVQSREEAIQVAAMMLRYLLDSEKWTQNKL